MRAVLPIGRIRRRDFFISKILIFILGYGAFLTFLIEDQNLAIALFCASLALLTYAEIVLFSKRIHDVGHSAWWVLLLMVPLANLCIVGMAFFCEGAEGVNRFGPDPIKNRKARIGSEQKKETVSETRVDLMDQIEQLKREHEALKKGIQPSE